MKRLHLIRHAKSSWDRPNLRDIERPLNARGLSATKKMAPVIIEAGWNCINIFCSPAVRAQQTIQNLAKNLPDHEINWVVDEALYTFSSRDLLNWCHHLNEGLSEVTIVGHNPAITDFTNNITGANILNVPTCGYIQIEISTVWKDIGTKKADLIEYITPKMTSH